ncbi:hypothetical protein ACU6U9_12110 [Pseudomonas sp. HK3]
MNARTQAKRPPIISKAMVVAACFIHVALSIINFNFTALVNGIALHNSHVNTLMLAMIQPAIVAAILAPILCTLRHTDFIDEFRNILFIAVGLFMIYTLADMAGILG